MKFSKKKLPKSQVVFDVQYTQEEFHAYRAAAIESLRKRMRLQGFRLGHVPFAVAEKRLEESPVLQKAAESAVREAWAAIVKQEALDPIGEPAVRILKVAPNNPLEFRIQVTLLPEIALPDYASIASQSARRAVAVEEKEVAEALQWLRESRKTKDGVTPEATNEFAQSLGKFTDLASLQASIEEGLRHEKTIKESERLRAEIVDHIAKQTKLEAPEILVEREKQTLLAQTKQAAQQVAQVPFEEYLANIGKTKQALLDSFREEAERRVKRFLVVREIAKKEGIAATPEEVEQETQALLRHYASREKTKQAIDPERLKEYTEGVIRHEKTLQFLEQFVQL